jgi:hypothetical protein
MKPKTDLLALAPPFVLEIAFAPYNPGRNLLSANHDRELVATTDTKKVGSSSLGFSSQKSGVASLPWLKNLAFKRRETFATYIAENKSMKRRSQSVAH